MQLYTKNSLMIHIAIQLCTVHLKIIGMLFTIYVYTSIHLYVYTYAKQKQLNALKLLLPSKVESML